jgi:uncharacterized protein (TIGR03435 family)
MESRQASFVAAGAIVIIGSMALGALHVQRLRAQSATGDEKPLAFEVASIKPNKSGDDPQSTRLQPGGGFSATNVSVRFLIRVSYGRFQEALVSGGPSWLDTDRYDIVAKGDGPASPPQINLMIRTLLADRFKLTTHQEMQELPIYALVLTRTDRRLGPQLRPATIECEARGPGGPPPPGQSQPGLRRPCSFRLGPGAFVADGVTMDRLASSLAPFVQRLVLDRTGLSGDFDLELHWTPDVPPRREAPPGAPPPPPIDPNGPSIFTAIQEQLGLKLESTKGPVDVLVIDHAERPTED